MSQQVFETVIERDVMVPMRDGVRLATDIYRPGQDGRSAEGRFPVILERTPYGKAELSRSEVDVGMEKSMRRPQVADHFVARGYIVVYQDCRGRWGSEGVFTKYLDEGDDGFDTVEWLAAQPWCNGQVATMGLSYAAHTQGALACLAPKNLAAMVIDSGAFASGFHAGMRQGGAFELRQVTWAFTHAKESPAAMADPLVRAALDAEDLSAWFKAMPWKQGHSPLRLVPEYENYLFEQWRSGNFDDYWKQLGIYTAGYYDQFSDVPQIHMSSWYDTYVSTATENYVALKARKKGPVRLIMGPWLHGDRVSTHSGGVDFGPAAPIDGNLSPNWRTMRSRWFDHWLKGEDNGVDKEPPVLLFLMGGGSGRRDEAGRMQHGGAWITGRDWPLPEAVPSAYYLSEDGRLSPDKPSGEASLSFDFDPAKPVPTIGGSFSSGAPIFHGGAFDQREEERFFASTHPGLPLSSRPDVLVFETEPLAQDMAVVGPIVVDLFVSSNCPDTDFTAKLIDVYPPNEDYPRAFAMNLTDGILRCRYRDSWEKPDLMEAGEVYKIRLELFATANLFKAGHRIRLDISSSNFPKYDVNPNSGEPEGMARLKRVATNSVFVGASRASSVTLPTVPTASLTYFEEGR